MRFKWEIVCWETIMCDKLKMQVCSRNPITSETVPSQSERDKCPITYYLLPFTQNATF